MIVVSSYFNLYYIDKILTIFIFLLKLIIDSLFTFKIVFKYLIVPLLKLCDNRQSVYIYTVYTRTFVI